MSDTAIEIIDNQKVRDIIYDVVDTHSLSIINAWITGSFVPYDETMRLAVYQWLVDNPGDPKAASILSAYENEISGDVMDESKLSARFSPLTKYDIVTRENSVVIREDVDKGICAIRKKNGKYVVKTFELQAK